MAISGMDWWQSRDRGQTWGQPALQAATRFATTASLMSTRKALASKSRHLAMTWTRPQAIWIWQAAAHLAPLRHLVCPCRGQVQPVQRWIIVAPLGSLQHN